MNYPNEASRGASVSAKSGRSSVTEEWDARFHLARIPPYDSATDKFIRRSRPGSRDFGRLNKSLRRPPSRPGLLSKLPSRAPSRRRLQEVKIRPNSSSKTLPGVKFQVTLEELKEKVTAAWDRWKVPDFHRREVQKSIQMKDNFLMDLLKEELVRLDSQEHPVLTVQRAIDRREAVLSTLKTILPNVSDDSKQLQVAELLETLRTASLDVVESVLKWRDFLRCSGVFLWEGQSYFAKMKRDLGFLKEFSHWFYISEDPDPFLLRTAGARTFQKHLPKYVKNDLRIPLPLVGNELQRIKQAELILSAESKEYNEPQPLEDNSVIEFVQGISPVLQDKTQEATDLESLDSLPFLSPVWQLEEIASGYMLSLVEFLVLTHLPSAVSESCKEVVTASLVLYSNTILDRLILLVLGSEIPICANEAYNEELDREYIAFQGEIMEMAVDLEVKHWSEVWVIEVLAEEVANAYCHLVPVLEIATESLAEETELNRALMSLLYGNIVDSLIAEEWLEILCENEYSDAMMVERYKELSQSVIRKLRLEQPGQELSHLAEDLYRDLLYAYVSTQWLKQLVTLVVAGRELETEDKEVFAFEIVQPKRSGFGRKVKL